MFSKKGQTMSINVIIVAVIALVILVVLIAIFTGRITFFEKGTKAAGNAELITMKVSYGNCRPNAAFEQTFVKQFTDAAGNKELEESARISFKNEIARCEGFADKGVCESNTGCLWS